MGKIIDLFNNCEIKYKWGMRALFIMLLATIIVIGVINKQTRADSTVVDNNVYLNEEVVFAKEVHMTVDSINVTTNEEDDGELDADNDLLSKYTLNLGLAVEQISNDSKADKVKISPSNFELKSVNLKAKSKMAVFIECLAKATLSMIVSGGVSGSINVIEETINFAADYTLENIKNAEYNKTDFKPIKCNPDSFEPFYPREKNGLTNLQLIFPIKQEYLESDNVMVLAIDAWNHIERRVFLITRPSNL